MSLSFQSVKFYGLTCPNRIRQGLPCPINEVPSTDSEENRIEVNLLNSKKNVVTVTVQDIHALPVSQLFNLQSLKSYFFFSKSNLDLTDQIFNIFKRIEEDFIKSEALEQRKLKIQELDRLIKEKNDLLQSHDANFKKMINRFQSEQETNSQYITLFQSLEAQDSLEDILVSLKKWSSSLLQQDVEVLAFSGEEATSFLNYFEENIYFDNNQAIAPILSQSDSFIAIKLDKTKLTEVNYNKLLNLQSIFNQKIKFIRSHALQTEELRVWKLALDQFSFPIAIINNQSGTPHFRNKSLIELNFDLNTLVTHNFHEEQIIVNGTQYVLERTSFKVHQNSYDILIFHNKSEERERLLRSISTEKLNVIGRLSDKLAHELRNPIGGIQNLIEIILQDPHRPKNQKEDLEQIRSGAISALKIIKSLQDFANNTNSDIITCNVFGLIRESLVFSKSLTRNMKILFDDNEAPILISVQPDLFKQVIFNLIQNSAQACQKKGVIEIQVTQLTEYVRISISDNGPGIPEHLRTEIFEPSFTTKKLGEGTGLGLAFVKRTVQSWKGHIFCTTSKSGGAQFEIDLPVAF